MKQSAKIPKCFLLNLLRKKITFQECKTTMIGMFYVVFFLVIAMFVFVFVKGISEWVHNNNSPRLSVDAKIVDKRMATHHHHSTEDNP